MVLSRYLIVSEVRGPLELADEEAMIMELTAPHGSANITPSLSRLLSNPEPGLIASSGSTSQSAQITYPKAQNGPKTI